MAAEQLDLPVPNNLNETRILSDTKLEDAIINTTVGTVTNGYDDSAKLSVDAGISTVGVGREIHNFVPPASLVKEDDYKWAARSAMEKFLDELMFQVHRRVNAKIGNVFGNVSRQNPAITKVFQGHRTRDNLLATVIEYDASKNSIDVSVRKQVAAVRKQIIRMFRSEFKNILKEEELIKYLWDVALVKKDVELDTMISPLIVKMNYIVGQTREKLKAGGQEALILDLATDAIKEMKYHTLMEIRRMEPKDAIVHNARALYSHKPEGALDEVIVSMFNLWTGEIKEPDAFIQELAHEIAHGVMRHRYPQLAESLPEHNAWHFKLTMQIAEQLRGYIFPKLLRERLPKSGKLPILADMPNPAEGDEFDLTIPRQPKHWIDKALGLFKF